MRAAALAFVAGALALQQQATLPSIAALVAILIAAQAVLLLFLLASRRIAVSKHLRRIVCILFAALAGFTWAAWRAQVRMADELPHAWEQRDVRVMGTVEALPMRFARGERFEFAVEQTAPADAPIPRALALTWYADFDAEDARAVPELRPGERWALTVRLRRPHGSANAYGFDYEYWLLEEGVRATGSVRSAEPDHPNARLRDFVWSFDHALQRLRLALRTHIETALASQLEQAP